MSTGVIEYYDVDCPPVTPIRIEKERRGRLSANTDMAPKYY